MEISIIVAVAENGVIGRNGEIPWNYPADLKHFKKETIGHPIIVGRKTYVGIKSLMNGPLPGRLNIVLSKQKRNSDRDNVVFSQSLAEAVETAENTGSDSAYIIGGESVYKQALDNGIADKIIMTLVPGEYGGDTYWPGPDPSDVKFLSSRKITDELQVVTFSTD